jgi:hypothetical protein
MSTVQIVIERWPADGERDRRVSVVRRPDSAARMRPPRRRPADGDWITEGWMKTPLERNGLVIARHLRRRVDETGSMASAAADAAG